MAQPETKINQLEAVSNPTERVLSPVEFNNDIDLSNLHFNPEFGAIGMPAEDKQRLLLFRAHRATDQDADVQILNRDKASAMSSLYGTGIYMGNSAESVTPFSWNEGREIGVYLTPAYDTEQLLDLSKESDSRLHTALRFGGLALKQTMILGTGARWHVRRTDKQYEDAPMVKLDMGYDTRIGQRIQTKPFDYPTRPYWFVYRDDPSMLTRVGTARRPIEAKTSVKKFNDLIRR